MGALNQMTEMGGKLTAKEFNEISKELSDIKINSATIQRAEDVHREISNIPVESLFRPFTV